jgi:hypothetical protein
MRRLDFSPVERQSSQLARWKTSYDDWARTSAQFQQHREAKSAESFHLRALRFSALIRLSGEASRD